MPRPPLTDQKPHNLKKSLKNLKNSLKSFKYFLIFACIAAVISTILSVFGPALLGNITTTAYNSINETGAIDWGTIKFYAILIVALYAASGIFGWIESYLLGIFAARYARDLRAQVLNKISKLPISYFDKHQFGDTLSRMTNDIDTVTGSLQESLSEIISNIIMLVGILAMMLFISPLLSVIALISIPVSIVFVAKIAQKAQNYYRTQQETLGKLNSTIEESYSGQLIIKSNSHEPQTIKDFRNKNNKLYQSAWRAQFFSSLAFPITHIFTNLSYVGVCMVGGYQAIAGRISVGNVQAFIQYTNQFNRPITQIAQISSTIQLTLAAAERVFDFLDETEEQPDPADAKQLFALSASAIKNKTAGAHRVAGAVEFHDVSFSYEKDQQIIKNFSCKIEPGMQVALVGPTGAGKTTIVNLLMRFYDPDSGYITIDDIPTRDMKRADVRKLFGMVLQDTWLFSGTIEENLRYGKKSTTMEEIVQCCKKAHIHHFIQSLPNGYQTKISEDSDNISAGEKQLLTIARAMIANPSMMILDEATSNVDTRTEQLIQDAFDKLTRGRTSFVIAHRLSTIRNADLILVMKNGQIVEQGNHDQLLRQNGFYAELYNSQFTNSWFFRRFVV